MKVLILGASGFIGSHIVKKLLKERHTVGVLVHNLNRIWRIKKEVQKGYVDIHVGDITRKADIERAIRNGEYDIIINTVAILSHPNKNQLEKVNVLGVKNLLEVALDYNIERVIHTSVACTLRKQTIKSEYFKTKIMGEYYAKKYYFGGLNIAIIRPTPVYGPLDNKGLTLIILATANNMIPLFPGSPRAKIKTIYVKDLADYYSKLVNMKFNGLEYHTVCGRETITLRELFEIISMNSGAKVPHFMTHKSLQSMLSFSSEFLSKISRVKNLAVDKEIIKLFWNGNYEIKCDHMTNWSPKYTVKKGINETIRWAWRNGIDSRIKLLSLMLKG